MSESEKKSQIPETEALGILTAVNPVLGFLTNNWKLCLVGVVLTALAGTYYTQKLEIAHYKKLYADDEKTIVTLKENNKTLTDSITDQNKQIDVAAKVNKDIQKQMDDLVDKFTKQSTIDQAVITKFKKIPLPKTCDEALKYLTDGI